jgi:hypothetical protein
LPADDQKLPLLNWPVVSVAAIFSFFIMVILIGLAWANLKPRAAPTSLTAVRRSRIEDRGTLDQGSLSLERTPPPARPHPAAAGQAKGPRPPVNAARPNRPPAARPAPVRLARVFPGPRLPHPAARTCARLGTAVDFVDTPTEAARQALQKHKLLFVLHVAGNFEDDQFT